MVKPWKKDRLMLSLQSVSSAAISLVPCPWFLLKILLHLTRTIHDAVAAIGRLERHYHAAAAAAIGLV